MEATILHQQSVAQAFLQSRESKPDVHHKAHLYPKMPVTPIYSRPGSSCSQPPTLRSNAAFKTVMLDTDFYDHHLPSTPPLSTSSSANGSPKMTDALQISINPFFSAFDSFDKDLNDSVETGLLDWPGCASPPMTPVYIASQPSVLQHTTSEILSMTSCPSLSPSPTSAYAQSVVSEQDVDFCDPRNLTVSAINNPTLAPEFNLCNLGDADVKGTEPPSTFDFNPAVSNALSAFHEIDDLDSDDDFSTIVNVTAGAPPAETRPRACTGSSIVSLGHCTFDDELSLDDNELFSFLPFPGAELSTMSSPDEHRDKKQKKSPKQQKAKTTLAHVETTTVVSDVIDSNISSPCDDSTSSVSAPSRRGRKQSLTEDPSKTFVCDLCNRRFRRQEHLKRHYRSLHTQEKPFECHECGKKFSRSDNLAQHARTHSGGAIVMDLIDGHASQALDASGLSTVSSDVSYGKLMFHVGSQLVGDVSEVGEEDGDNQKKRKRCD